MDILSLKLDWTSLARLNIFWLSPCIVAVLARIMVSADPILLEKEGWKTGDIWEGCLDLRLNTSWEKNFGQQEAVSRPQASVLTTVCISLRASAKEQKTDEWPVNAAYILGDSQFMVFWGEIVLIKGVGQPCGYWAGSLVRGHPKPR